MMKKIGIIGGLGWPSTVDYYRLLCKKANDHFGAEGFRPPLPTPNIVIESLNIRETRKLRGKEGDDDSWVQFEAVFVAAFKRLQSAGADFGLIASNTPHMRLPGIARHLDLPIISILDATAKTAIEKNMRRVLVLGTTVTMNSPVYYDTLKSHGLAAVPKLSQLQIAELNDLIDRELYRGRTDGARERILELCHAHIKHESDGVCLGCTELSLAFPEHQELAYFVDQGISFVNSTVAHVEAALTEALSARKAP